MKAPRQVDTHDFDGKCITWEGRSFHKRGIEGNCFGMAFYGAAPPC